MVIQAHLTSVMIEVSHCIHCSQWGVINHPCPNFIGALIKSPLKLGYEDGWHHSVLNGRNCLCWTSHSGPLWHLSNMKACGNHLNVYIIKNALMATPYFLEIYWAWDTTFWNAMLSSFSVKRRSLQSDRYIITQHIEVCRFEYNSRYLLWLQCATIKSEDMRRQIWQCLLSYWRYNIKIIWTKLCFVLFCYGHFTSLRSNHIIQCCFTDTGAIMILYECQWNNLEAYA